MSQKSGIGWIDEVRRQLAASIDMLHTAIETATEEVWNNEYDDPRFWRVAAHVTLFIDFYFSTLDENILNPSETYMVPEFLQKYGTNYLDDLEKGFVTKSDLLNYLEHSRKNLRVYFDNDITPQLAEDSGFDWLSMNKGELLLYNMRHIMEHVAILNQILKKYGLKASSWRKTGQI